MIDRYKRKRLAVQATANDYALCRCSYYELGFVSKGNSSRAGFGVPVKSIFGVTLRGSSVFGFFQIPSWFRLSRSHLAKCGLSAACSMRREEWMCSKLKDSSGSASSRHDNLWKRCDKRVCNRVLDCSWLAKSPRS